MSKLINVSDFSEDPGLRHCSISDDSGEEFYHKVLNKAFKDAYEAGEHLCINLDNTAGFAPSFLDEAFGNLVFDFGLDVVKDLVEIISVQEPDLKDMIINETYKQWEERREGDIKPEKTAPHPKWYRLTDGKTIVQVNI